MDLEECAICGMNISDKYPHTLKCGHKFHYECLIKTFVQTNLKNLRCPYCREKCEYMPIINGLKRIIPGVHCNLNDNKNKSNELVLKSNYNKTCKYIFKKGKRKGEECGKNCKLGYYVCSAHFKFDTN